MAKYELKTKMNDASVSKFIETIENETKREDCKKIIDLMAEVTNIEPKMFGSGIVAFGKYHYKYASGHEGDSCLVGFAPRKTNISIYLAPYYAETSETLKSLGKFKLGKGCLYINKLEDIDTTVLKKLIIESVEHIKKLYPDTK